jgi:hypothetical protein
MNKVQLPVVITPSRTEVGTRCHRRHFLGDILSRARYFSPSLEFGSVIHAGVASHWLGQKQLPAVAPGMAVADEWSKRKVESDSLTLQLAQSIIGDYQQNAQLAGPFTGQGNFKLVDVEQRFELDLAPGIKMTFQCDRIVHDADQNWTIVVDSKTSQRLDQRWDRQWEVSLQMKLYRAGVINTFQTNGRVDIVVEGILKHSPSTLRYYICPEWSEGILLEALRQAQMIAELDKDILSDPVGELYDLKTIEEYAVSLTPVNYQDCYSYNTECPFRRICIADVDQRVALLHAEYFELEEESY